MSLFFFFFRAMCGILTDRNQKKKKNRRMREKIQDEYDAMMICREKVAQRGLPMQIVDAEYQWSVFLFLLSSQELY